MLYGGNQLMRSILVKSILHHRLLALRSFYERRLVMGHSDGRLIKTAYCVGPYKTGTTFVASVFSADNRVAHEPMHYTTLKMIDDPAFLRNRAHYLNLDLECSGFWAGRLHELRDIVPDARILCIMRSPASWIESVINYFCRLSESIRYNYVARLHFDEITKYPVDSFFNLPNQQQSMVVRQLADYWLRCYDQALTDERALLVRLELLSEQVDQIESFVGLKALHHASAFKRESKNKTKINICDYIDSRAYSKEFARFGYDCDR
jgi:hypothetical protein